MILTGEPIDAQEAYRIGLVNEIVGAEILLERAAEILRTIAANAPLAVRFSIEAVNRGLQVARARDWSLRVRCLPCVLHPKTRKKAPLLLWASVRRSSPDDSHFRHARGRLFDSIQKSWA